MYLKKLELSGFKSFAKPARLEFPHPAVAIVGPNGSGKSNIAEAIRWVLGEQSIKSLRGKKGEDLIFNGSQTAPRLGKASVSLFLDNRKKILPIDYEEVKITRKVFRDGVNEYLVNDSKVRHKDVVEILGKIGIGSSGHHIISQGEADRILSASLKERRQMIEDALGLKIFQIKKAEAERKLEKTGENMKQVESLKKEIQPHLRFLKKQAEKAQEVSTLRENLKKFYAKYIFSESAYLTSEEKKISEEKNKIESELEKIKKEISGTAGGSRDSKILKAKRELEDKLREKEKSARELREKQNSVEREMGRLEGIIEVAGKKEAKEEKAVPSSEAKNFIKELERLVDRGLGFFSVDEIKRILGEISGIIRDFSSRLDSGTKISGDEINEFKKKQKDTQELLVKIKEQEKKMVLDSDSLKKELDALEESLRGMEKERYEAEGRMKELNGFLESVKIKEDNLKIKKNDLKSEIGEARAMADYSGEETEEIFELGRWTEERQGIKKEIERLKIKIDDSGAIGGEVLKEYEEVKKRDEFFEKELADLDKSVSSLEVLLKELEEKIGCDFKEGIEKINKEFQKFFEAMFGGGRAELVRIAPPRKSKKENADAEEINNGAENEEPQEGVEVRVNLPKKRIASLDMLSGGERALTSIALLFAMSQVNPPPFLVLDETDAALDEANSQKYGNMLKDLSERTQLLIITHNRETMSQAGILYGVTMGSDSISKLLSIKFTEAERYTNR